jgi:hypothetical protein
MHFLTSVFSILPMSTAHAQTAPALAPQVTNPQTVDEALTMLNVIVKLFQEGQYLLAGAALTLVLVFIFRRFFMHKLSTKALPLISIVTGLVTGISLAILSGASPTQALLASLSGSVASSLWDAGLKYFVPEKVLHKPETPAEEKKAA